MHAGVLPTGVTRDLQENVRRQLDEGIGLRSQVRRSLYNGVFGEEGLMSHTDVISFDKDVERFHRDKLPDAPSRKQLVKNLNRCETVMRDNGSTTAVVWKDKKPVYVISSAHPPSTTAVNRKNADGTVIQVPCPGLISEYNRYMKGVDLSDQLKGCYGLDQKSKHCGFACSNISWTWP